MSDIGIDVDLLHEVVEASVQRALEQAPTPRFLVGVITATNEPNPGMHEVQLNGDTTSVPCHNVSNITFSVGNLAAIAFTPPHQLWIIGRVTT